MRGSNGPRTKKAAVICALKEYILRHKQKKILKIFGTIEYCPDRDYKQYQSRVKIEKKTEGNR